MQELLVTRQILKPLMGRGAPQQAFDLALLFETRQTYIPNKKQGPQMLADLEKKTNENEGAVIF